MKQKIIKEGIRKLKENHHKPKAVWQDGDMLYIVTDNTDRSKYAKLIKKFK